MADKIYIINPPTTQKKSITAITSSPCCDEGCLRNYQLNWRSDVVPGSPIPQANQALGDTIAGVARVYAAPVNLNTTAGQKQLLLELKESLYQLGYGGDSLRIQAYSDNTFELSITDSDIRFNSLQTDTGDIDFQSPTDAVAEDCQCFGIEPPVIPEPVPGQSSIFFFQFNRNGNLNNNAYLEFGNTVHTLLRGMVVPFNYKVLAVTVNRRLVGAPAGTFNLRVNGIVQDSFTIAALQNDVELLANTGYTGSALDRLAIQWLGTANNNVSLILKLQNLDA